MEFENQTDRISNQLEYERRREEQLLTNVQKFERTVQDDEDALETAKKIGKRNFQFKITPLDGAHLKQKVFQFLMPKFILSLKII